MADYSITQHIPVADHVYKFLLKRCGSDAIEASRTNFIGSLILSLHGRNTDVKYSKTRNFSKIFSIKVPYSLYDKTGVHISEVNAQLFNDQIDKLFRDEIFVHMLINKDQDKKHFLKSLKSFLTIYDITEEDIKLETLHRDFKRKKDDYEEKLSA
ncbi:hypothetical protein [Mesonia aestuariivivens]|uniref:Uncharacterized protein n=1 Tax=Mesonia aestuariivivens TaxID=2796128 RepID=A0ABS6W360_9FLAO|nr:hypothetical protein [Mesonia aestuariivivens]MBW2962298.1 hypothetical protein [Mesonia aestuariivivens]